MGRETITVCHWQGQSIQTKVLLETSELILRGGLKAKLARSDLLSARVTEDGLTIETTMGALRLDVSEPEARKWAQAIAAPPPSLAQKLGVSPAKRAWVIGRIEDGALLTALDGATTPSMEDASVLVAQLNSEADVRAALDLAQKCHLSIWCVYRKGGGHLLNEAIVRTTMRAHGLIDNKSCAVSDLMTATRYAWRAKS